MKPLVIGTCECHWLNGGSFRLDGGALFGQVPKVIWQHYYPPASDNTIALCNDPLLIRTPSLTILVDSGLGNKLTVQEQALLQTGPWQLLSQLAVLGISRQDIDLLLLTHGDFDHAGGVVMLNEHGQEELTFPAATHLIQQHEWQDMILPGPRGQESYWPLNFKLLATSGRLQVIQGDHQLCPEVRVSLTGGHTRGHQLVEISSQGDTAVHLGDLFPTHAHSQPLTVMAYDNFPLEVIACKERYFAQYRQRDAWFTFYHDPVLRACKLGDEGQITARWS